MYESDHGYGPPATQKEVVIYKGGWGFRLPDQHRALLNRDGSTVSVSTPDRGGIYYVDRVDETEDEFRIHVGDQYSGHGLSNLPTRYPFPSIDDELSRLTSDYNARRAAATPDAPVGWAQGASYDSHTNWLAGRNQEDATRDGITLRPSCCVASNGLDLVRLKTRLDLVRTETIHVSHAESEWGLSVPHTL